MTTAIYINNDHTIKVEGLQDQDGNAVTTATVEATILDLNRKEVGGITWPLTLSHDGNGTYSATLDKAVSLQRNVRHYLRVVASTSGGADAEWTEPLVAKEREA